MANLLQSSATTATQAPAYYTDYLSNLATSGSQAAQNAQFVGAQPLQEQAFSQVADKATAYQPTLTAAGNTLAQSAATPSPLSAAAQYYQTAGQSPAQLAQQYMDPYTQSVISNLGDMGARNIQMNLAPQATAAAVGSGQFGSKRGAEVLGQTINNANRDILNQQASALNTAYQNALTTAEQQNALNQTMGTNAGNLQVAGQNALTNTGTAQGNLASTNQNLSLADINALATLGQQQQTIAQNKQNFPLTTLSTLAGLMAGQNIPTSTVQTAETSPLAAMASVGSGLGALFQGTGAGGTGPSLFQNMTGQKDMTGLISAIGGGAKNAYDKLTAQTDLPPAPGITYNYNTGGYQNTQGQATDSQGNLMTGTTNANSASTDTNALTQYTSTSPDTSSQYSSDAAAANIAKAYGYTMYDPNTQTAVDNSGNVVMYNPDTGSFD